MNRTVLILVGLPGCGKTTASDFFQKLHISVVRMGKITEMLLQKKDLPTTEENERFIRVYLRKKYGDDIYARTITREVIKKLVKHYVVVIEGLRSEVELTYLKKNLPSVKLVFIDTDKKIRYLRLLRRRPRPLTINEARQRDAWEKSLGVVRLKKSTDMIISNQGTKSDFYEKLNQIINKIHVTC